MNYFKFLFFFTLVYMSFIGWSSNSWIVIWFIMEVMFLFFIGLVSIKINYSIIEVLMKYFIVQVFISLLFMGVMIYFLFNMSLELNFVGLITLSMKLGLFPFHFWIVMILGKLNWFSFLVMTTLMKLLPILMFYYMAMLINFNFIIMLSVMVGSIMGLNNTLIQKLMGYSSMVQLCWLLVSLQLSNGLFFFYFFCYLTMMTVLIMLFSKLNVFYINQYKLLSESVMFKLLIFLVVLSLAGFPPFIGFTVKWVISSMLFWMDMKLIFYLMIFFSLFSSLFYLQLFYYFMMILGFNNKIFNLSLSYSYMMFFMAMLFFSYLYLYLLV